MQGCNWIFLSIFGKVFSVFISDAETLGWQMCEYDPWWDYFCRICFMQYWHLWLKILGKMMMTRLLTFSFKSCLFLSISNLSIEPVLFNIFGKVSTLILTFSLLFVKKLIFWLVFYEILVLTKWFSIVILFSIF